MNNMKQISDFESRYKMVIPIPYKDFLQNENGISFNGGTILYSLDELKQMNDNLQIQEYQPNYLAIGDDGGGLVFLMRQEPDAKEVICVDISDYDIESSFSKIDNFTDWYKDGCKICTETQEDNWLSKAGDVFLIKEPRNGMKDLIKIKQVFNMDIAISQLLALSKELPCLVIKNIKYAKAIKLMEKVGQLDIFEFCENSDYGLLEEEGALSRVSENDIRRVLNEYNPNENIITPPDDYYNKIYINKYKDGSGYHVDIDLWYCSGRSDLTLQIDIRKKECNEWSFKIDDLRVV